MLGLPDERWGEAITAVIVVHPDQQLTAETIRQHARERLADYAVPQREEFVAELPSNQSGKLLNASCALSARLRATDSGGGGRPARAPPPAPPPPPPRGAVPPGPVRRPVHPTGQYGPPVVFPWRVRALSMSPQGPRRGRVDSGRGHPYTPRRLQKPAYLYEEIGS
ncbi:AMP-binding enzyme [Kocuria palustris]|uniref:AMP-binding enzyme n=1 Tax=Kocuria palustris TaxID=71999 RepID=UPI0035E33057